MLFRAPPTIPWRTDTKRVLRGPAPLPGRAFGTGTRIALSLLRMRSLVVLILVLACAPRGLGGPPPPFQHLVAPVPFCEHSFQLGVGREFFVEIANPLPGVDAYNEMVRRYRASDWEGFDERANDFRRHLSRSPLAEPGSFLQAQAGLERLDDPESEAFREVEKRIRELQVLYPKSRFALVSQLELSAFWVRHGLARRALGGYESVRRRAQGTGGRCVATAGSAEAHFQLRDLGAAKSLFEEVYARCRNLRLRAAASMRLADMRLLLGDPGAVTAYETFLDAFAPLAYKNFSAALANMGELQFQRGEYRRARHYFEEFSRRFPRDIRCGPQVTRRLADLALAEGKKPSVVVGQYFAARDGFPDHPLGRASYIRGLLLELSDVSRAERERRLRLVTEGSARLGDLTLDAIARMEHSLALLGTGDWRALFLVERDREARGGALFPEPLARWARGKFLDALARESSETEALAALERAYEGWLRGTSGEGEGRSIYEAMIVRRITQAIDSNVGSAVMADLARYSASPWGSGNLAGRRVSVDLGIRLLAWLDGARAKEAAGLILAKKDVVEAVLQGRFPLLWATVAETLQQSDKLAKLAPEVTPEALGSSLSNRIPSTDRAMAWIAASRVLLAAGRPRDALAAIARVPAGERQRASLEVSYRIKLALGLRAAVFDDGIRLLDGDVPEHRKDRLEQLRAVAVDGELWDQARPLRDRAAVLLGPGEMAPYDWLQGKAAFESGDCDTATSAFRAALATGTVGEPAAEARFRISKCLLRANRQEQARAMLEELAKSDDRFWSPLARGELARLSP